MLDERDIVLGDKFIQEVEETSHASYTLSLLNSEEILKREMRALLPDHTKFLA